MGLVRRIAKAVERKLDGPPQPPAYAWPPDQAWALLLTSERDPGTGGYRDEAPSMVDDLVDRTRGIPYRFELEVHRPDRAPHTVVQEVRVPGKVEGTLFLRSEKIPPGVEAPLRVTGAGDDDIELDWDGYLAIPDQADRAYHLRIAESRGVQERIDGGA